MKFIFIDTETNGLPASRWVKEDQWQHWPEIVQFGWEVWEVKEGQAPKILLTEDYVFKQEPNIKWDKEAEKFHKIPLQICQKDGVVPKVHLQRFTEILAGCDALVAHNLDFDRKVVRAALYRYGIQPWKEGSLLELCTMRGAQTNFNFGLDKAGKPKAPRLMELHNAVIPGTYDCSGNGPWHEASHDLHCAALCFWAICQRPEANAFLTKSCQLTGRKFTLKEKDLLKSIALNKNS